MSHVLSNQNHRTDPQSALQPAPPRARSVPPPSWERGVPPQPRVLAIQPPRPIAATRSARMTARAPVSTDRLAPEPVSATGGSEPPVYYSAAQRTPARPAPSSELALWQLAPVPQWTDASAWRTSALDHRRSRARLQGIITLCLGICALVAAIGLGRAHHYDAIAPVSDGPTTVVPEAPVQYIEGEVPALAGDDPDATGAPGAQASREIQMPVQYIVGDPSGS